MLLKEIMMNKIKEFLATAWGYIVLVLGAIAGILIYTLQAKQKKIDALNAKIDLADTQKKADLIEADIKQHLDNNKLLDKEVKELNKSLDLLAQKRQELAKTEPTKSPDEIEDFWNKKK